MANANRGSWRGAFIYVVFDHFQTSSTTRASAASCSGICPRIGVNLAGILGNAEADREGLVKDEEWGSAVGVVLGGG